MGKNKREAPGEALEKAVGRMGETAGKVTGEKSLEAEGRALRRKSELKSYMVAPREEGGWKVQAEGASRATSVHRTKAEGR